VEKESKPYLIGIAGPSCAGKTELAGNLALELSASILPLDCYYFDLSDRTMEQRAQFNFDEPDALDQKLFAEHVRSLSQGKPTARPAYDFSTHARTGGVEIVEPRKFLIVEGLFVLYWPEVREMFGTRVFVDLPDDRCLERRLVRDVRERGRTPESVRKQFAATVRPMAELHVRPTRAYADLVLSGDHPIRNSIRAVLDHIRETSLAFKIKERSTASQPF
jgi:uridine kinase